MNYPFEKNCRKENALKMATSADKNSGVYSWDNSGGTMRFFNQIFQFKYNNQIITNVHLAEKDPQAFFSKIYTVQNKKNENIYLVISNSILSNKYLVQHINAYKTGTKTLQSLSVFKKDKYIGSNFC